MPLRLGLVSVDEITLVEGAEKLALEVPLEVGTEFGVFVDGGDDVVDDEAACGRVELGVAAGATGVGATGIGVLPSAAKQTDELIPQTSTKTRCSVSQDKCRKTFIVLILAHSFKRLPLQWSVLFLSCLQ